jgi:DNA-binding response OmpR family regulator
MAENRPDPNRPNLMIVEPDEIIRSEISEFLRDCGFRVLETATGDEAMLILNAEGMHLAVVLVDASAPGNPHGFGLAKWLRENRPGIDVILTGTPERATKEAGNLCDDGPALSKPYDPQLVLDRIKRLIAARERNAGR